jgi:hypothetical protein
MKLSENFKQKLIAILKYILFYWAIYLYTHIVGIAKWNSEQLKMEVPVVMYLYFLFNGILKNDRFQYVGAAIPILIVYIIHDLYFFTFGKTPRLIEIKELPELVNVLDVKHLSLLLFLFIPLGVFFIKFDKNKLKLFLLRSLPLFIVIFLMIYTPESLAKYIDKIGNIVEWSDVKTVKKNGRIITAIYYEAKRRYAYNQLSNYRDLTKLKLKVTEKVLNKINNRNVHLIILESFIDPRWFNNLKFNINPAHDSFMRLLDNKVGSSLSPVFGGGTAQAEFEVLCGVPAFREIDSVEFNVFTGSKTYCLPEILNEAGYLTIVTNPYRPYFNAINAYKGLGFNQIYFPTEYVPNNKTYLKLDDTPGGYLFDGSLLRQNLDFMSRVIHNGKPVLNYILGIYGHFNFERNEEIRPSIIKTDSAIPEIDRIANQFFERTQAIAEFVNKINLVDPNSLIIITSDHLPPLKLSSGKNVYSELGYLKNIPNSTHYTPFIVIKNGEVVKYDNFYHFSIYRLILDYLTDGSYCKEYNCKSNADNKSIYYNDYLTILGLASR